jgi:hypothetical protein
MEGQELYGDYAPADFGDADDNRPIGAFFDIGISQTTAPYTTAMNNVVQRHLFEVKQNTTPSITPNQWKRRFRDFIMTHTNDVLEFATKPLAKHPTLGPTEILIRKFSRPNFLPNHSSLRDIALDASGVDILTSIEQGLRQFDHTLKGFQEQSRYLFDLFRGSLEEIIRQNTVLSTRLAVFDKAQSKIMGLLEGEQNEFFQPLAESTEKYLKKVFEDNQIEEVYKTMIEAYRKFFLLKDIVSLRRILDTSIEEPLCNICFQEQVQYAIAPCGHTYCGICIKKQFTSCYICRGPVRDRIRLYFG